MTATLELKLPDNVKLSDLDIKMTLAAKLYEMGTLSGGQAAELAGVSKRTFLESLGQYGVSIFGYSAEELEEDLARLRKCRSLLQTPVASYSSQISNGLMSWKIYSAKFG
jgi:predicted HTH domain antitoxin